MDEDTTRREPATVPGWFDDPFSRTGQRWWDGRQWTRRTRGTPGPTTAAPPSVEPASSDHPAAAVGTAASWLRPYGLVVLGLIAAVTLVGLTAPSAEESGVADLGYRRAAYWACTDLLERQLPQTTTASFPGDSSATVVQDGRTWQVSAVVELDSGGEMTRQTWQCTVVYDDGTWRGTATFE